MTKRSRTQQQVQTETAELKNRLEETEETLHAIRQYLVDAFVINRENDTEVVTLGNAEFPYRMMVESMNEGAATLIPDGTIFYCNSRFAEMVQLDCEKLIGVRFQDLIQPEEQSAFDSIFVQARQNGARGEFTLKTMSGARVPVQLSVHPLGIDEGNGISIIATDMSERMRSEAKIRLLASQLTMAEQQERHRISQVLHDDLQQRLFAIKAQLSLIQDATKAGGDLFTLETDFNQVQDWLAEAISITRDLSVDLSPVVLQGEGLKEALIWLASQMKQQYGLEIDLETRESSPLDDHIRLVLFQATRELLFNVVKHASTMQASVLLDQVDGQARITIRDEGKGFNVAEVMNDPKIAHGLLFIQNRLNLMGSSMKVSSKPGEGTTVVIETPLNY